MAFYTYIVASQRNGTIYVGQTDAMMRRISQHREGAFAGFSKKYGATRLVWWELHDTREGAVRRERQIKKWNRAWKLQLIEAHNPQWLDLFELDFLAD